MPKETQNVGGQNAPYASSKIKQKDNIYEAEYLGSGTFEIVKPKRAKAKLRQSRLKGNTPGARK